MMFRILSVLLLLVVIFPRYLSQTLSSCEWCRYLQSYPVQYIASKLNSNNNNHEEIIIDGYLNDSGWQNINFTNTRFVDIAQSLYNSSDNGYIIPSNFSTHCKIRWDNNYLYVGAVLYEPYVYGSVTGHNTGLVPYLDHDFEMFIDVSGTTWYYKEIEINVLNATYDQLSHKTKPIPCNNTANMNHASMWCKDTTQHGNSQVWNINGNWTMYDTGMNNQCFNKSNNINHCKGMQSATSIQHSSDNNNNIKTQKQKSIFRKNEKIIKNNSKNSANNKNNNNSDNERGCPIESPNVWTAWSQLSDNCNEWPETPLYKSWTVEIAMPFEAGNNYGGLLDTGINNTLNNIFYQKYNPNNINNNNDVLYWWLDFARTEHPMCFQNNNTLEPCTNKTLLAQAQMVYPSLLGVYSYNNYFEWVWQPVGVTKYMHYPEFWGIIQFDNNNNDDNKNDKLCQNIEWPGRYIAYQIWWANNEYFIKNNGTYAYDVKYLINNNDYCLFGYCDLQNITNAINKNDSAFDINIYFDSDSGCVGFLNYGKYENNQTYQLYGGQCYHLSVKTKVTQEYYYIVNVTQDHLVTLDTSHMDPTTVTCLNSL